MAIQTQFRRGNTYSHSLFTGASGEITVDLDKKVAVVHDGATVGGFPLSLAAYTTAAYNQANTATTIAGLAYAAANVDLNYSVAGVIGSVSNVQLAAGITSSGLLTTSNVAELTNLYYTNARVYAAVTSNLALKANVVDLTTSNVAELTNFYYTNARVHANVTERLSNLNISIIPAVSEIYSLGSLTNKFKDLYLSGNTIVLGNVVLSSSQDGLSVESIRSNVWSGLYTANVIETIDNLYYTNARVYAAVTGNLALKANVVDLTTANIVELTNLYFTNTRARTSISMVSSNSSGKGSYDSNTGVISVTAANVTVSLSAPVNPFIGDKWIEAGNAIAYLYFYDGDSYQWAEI